MSAFDRGVDPYQQFANVVDYPPNSFIVLYPLLWPSSGMLLWTSALLSVGGAALAVWWSAGWLSEQAGIAIAKRGRLVLVAMILASSSVRSGVWRGQPAPLAFLFGAAALHWSERRPWLAAIALTCCAFKPHVALAFALALLVTAGARIVIAAGAGVVALSWWFAVQTGQDFATAWHSYASALFQVYGGPEHLRGLLSVRWVIEDLANDFGLGTLIYAAAGAVTGALILDAALKRTDRPTRALVAATIMLWTLIFLPNQLYHGWLSAPALWLMMWPESKVITSERLRAYAVAAFVSFGVIDVPRVLRLLVNGDDNWPIYWVSYALSPLRLALLFGLLLLVILRITPAGREADIHAAA